MNIRHLSHLRAALLFAAIGLLSRPAQANIIVGAAPVTAAVGSIGNHFDVFLTNNGPGSVTISGFTFEISVASPFISFTSATTSTALPYIFDGNSVFGPDLTVAATGQSLAASDLYAIPLAGATVAAGSTAGLGRVSFDVLAGATPGTFPVIFSPFPSTSLSDPNALDIPITSLISGSIAISGQTPAPDPPTGILVAGVLLMALSSRIFKFCRRPGKAMP